MKTKSKLTRKGLFFIAFVIVGFLFFNQQIFSQKEQTGNKPNVNIRINKQIDKDGNITSYDSTYSYSWSSNEDDSTTIDSIFNTFGNRFNHSFFNTLPDTNNLKAFMYPSFMFDNNANMQRDIFDEMEKMMQNQEALMKQFFNNKTCRKPTLIVPKNIEPEQKAVPQKQNYQATMEL